MPSGGARNRSGPPADPTSGRSDRRNYTLTSLPASYAGPIPEFPLADPSDREIALWNQKWSGPHGAAWALESESWRTWDVALWVRTAVRCEDPEAPAALIGNLHRLGDRVGLSTAGLTEMGWKVAVDELAKKAATTPAAAKPKSSRSRLKSVPANGA